MQMPVIVAVIIAIIALVVFSGWFYHLAQGWREIVLDDVYFNLRIVGASLLSGAVICITFFILALVNQCKEEPKNRFLGGLGCKEYENLMTTKNELLKIGNETVDPTLEEEP